MIRFFWIVVLAFACTLQADEVHEVMDKVFEEHVKEKKMTEEVMKRSVVLFIDQFDPHRIYLLEREVSPLLDFAQKNAGTLVQDYEEGVYPFFSEMVTEFQKAIMRSRRIRQKLPLTISQEIESKNFPASIEDLENHIQAYLRELIERNGGSREKAEEALQDFESGYLYVDKEGDPLSPSVQEEKFSLFLLKAFTASLDAHSAFFNAEEASQLKTALEVGQVDAGYIKVEGGIIGKIALHSFYEGENGVSAVSDVRKAIQALSKRGKLKGLILDLRDNHGGFLMQAVAVAGLFIKTGVVVISKDVNGKERFYRDLDPSRIYSGPLVVLTSRMTASAAEIVAEALKDYGVAIIVGDERTYGKGSIQMQTVTSEKNILPLKITIGEYYGVSGKSTQITGVKADVIAPSPYFNKKVGEEYLDYSLKEDSVLPAYTDTISDIRPEMKDWYFKHYIPYLQKRELKYKDMLPELQERSRKRLHENKKYQELLEYDLEVGVDDPRVEQSILDEQTKEAVHVIQDMIQLGS